jgi:hypothetical protein
MKISIFFYPCIIFTLVLTNCNKKLDLKGFDSVSWKADKNGCNGLRNKQSTVLNKISSSMIGISESQLLDILGKPNRYELGERGTRNYEYYLKGDKSCLQVNEKLIPRLIVYMDAIGKVSLVLIKV